MRFVLYAVGGLAAALALEASAPASRPNGPPGNDLAARLAGTWTGRGTDEAGSQSVTMRWKKASDGHMTGTVAVAGEAKYPVNVVWSSDTAFIYESAPHMSHTLHERVVTRSLVHFKGDALDGTFQARPTAYKGRTLKGSFSVTHSS